MFGRKKNTVSPMVAGMAGAAIGAGATVAAMKLNERVHFTDLPGKAVDAVRHFAAGGNGKTQNEEKATPDKRAH